MLYDLRALDRSKRYRIISQCVTPRPIAWVSTVSGDGVANLSPFSFFNALGDNPPVLALGLVAHGEGRLKDTAANIRDTGEFVVHLVGEANGPAMNLSSIDAPPEVDEGDLAGLEMVPSAVVGPRRIAEAPVSFECRTLHWIETGQHQVAVLGEILVAHIRDEYLRDPDRIVIDAPAMKLIARLHGAGWYSRQTDMFEMLRPKWSERADPG